MQGYVTIATGAKKYLDMAINLALSIKRFDVARPTCLIHDDALGAHADEFGVFGQTVLLPPEPGFIGVMEKMRLYEYAPYEENMFVDADCLMTRTGIDRYWTALQRFDFSMTGDKRTTGRWNDMVIPQVLERFRIDYVVQMNSGVLYFKKNPVTADLFQCVRDLYGKHASLLSNVHKGVTGQWTDEPFFGTAMGIKKIEPLQQQGDHSWMVSTWRASGFRLDPRTKSCTFNKHSKFLFGLPFLPLRMVRHSPIFTHFINLKPQAVYRRLADDLRREFGVR